nr:MAG TPA: hypothetical protein [Caudoviricetes sp.]
MSTVSFNNWLARVSFIVLFVIFMVSREIEYNKRW